MSRLPASGRRAIRRPIRRQAHFGPKHPGSARHRLQPTPSPVLECTVQGAEESFRDSRWKVAALPSPPDAMPLTHVTHVVPISPATPAASTQDAEHCASGCMASEGVTPDLLRIRSQAHFLLGNVPLCLDDVTRLLYLYQCTEAMFIMWAGLGLQCLELMECAMEYIQVHAHPGLPGQ